MKVHDLARAVARATGESIRFVKAMGFSPLTPPIPRNWSKSNRRRQRKQPDKMKPAPC